MVSHRIAAAVAMAAAVPWTAGCRMPAETWPPPPRDRQEERLIEAAARLVDEHDGWKLVEWVVERHDGRWRVQAWQVLNPGAKGRMRCAPWAVRGIIFDNNSNLVEYRNHL